MYKNIIDWFLILMLLSFAISHLPISATREATTSSEPVISVEPMGLINIPEDFIGATFVVNVSITNVINLYSYGYKFYYENIPLNATSVVEKEFLRTGGPTQFEVIQLDREYNATHGIVWVNCTLLGTPSGVNGTGTLEQIFFRCLEAGSSSFYLRDTKLYDPERNVIPHATVDDGFPLEPPPFWNPPKTKIFNVTWQENTFKVATYSNSTVAKLNFTQPLKQISFYVNGLFQTEGFCNITIPKELLDAPTSGNWTVLVNGKQANPIVTTNDTHTSLYFTYHHSTHMVQIIGTKVVLEFPAVIILPLFMIVSLFAVILRKRKL